MQPNACVPDYRQFQQRIGTGRVIVVTPAAYSTDNEVTLDAIAQLGSQARGVTVVHPTVTDAELTRYPLGQRGSRGATGPASTSMMRCGWYMSGSRSANAICATSGSLATRRASS